MHPTIIASLISDNIHENNGQMLISTIGDFTKVLCEGLGVQYRIDESIFGLDSPFLDHITEKMIKNAVLRLVDSLSKQVAANEVPSVESIKTVLVNALKSIKIRNRPTTLYDKIAYAIRMDVQQKFMNELSEDQLTQIQQTEISNWLESIANSLIENWGELRHVSDDYPDYDTMDAAKQTVVDKNLEDQLKTIQPVNKLQ